MQDINTQVLRVNAVSSRDGQSIRHVVSLAGGTASDGTTYPAEDYATFDAALGAKAQSLQGQPVSARVDIVQKPKRQGSGFWTNFVLEDIGAQGTLQPMAMPTPGGTPAQPVTAQPTMSPQAPVAAPNAQEAPAPTPTPHPLLAEQEAQKSEERRRSAMHAACEFVGSALASGLFLDYTTALQAVAALTDDLAHYAGTGQWVQINPGHQTGVEVAQAVNQEADAEVVTAGVPFDTSAQPAA